MEGRGDGFAPLSATTSGSAPVEPSMKKCDVDVDCDEVKLSSSTLLHLADDRRYVAASVGNCHRLSSHTAGPF